MPNKVRPCSHAHQLLYPSLAQCLIQMYIAVILQLACCWTKKPEARRTLKPMMTSPRRYGPALVWSQTPFTLSNKALTMFPHTLG
jgi:hypothetical protein